MRFDLGKCILYRNVRNLSVREVSDRVSARFYSDEMGKIEKKVSETSPGSMEKTYNSEQIESKWYSFWESKGYFKPKEDGKVFTIILPPPNLTGTLHLGHALTITIQDVFVRWMRMKGRNVVWIPGFDHAGIASQLVVEKYLQSKFNVTKNDLGKEEFLQRASDWMSKQEEKIIKQIRQMGASVDWNRKYYTMDDKNSETVIKAFLHLNDKGLIYHHIGLVSWSTELRSTVPDTEIKLQDIPQPTKIRVPGYDKPVEFGFLYNIAYKIWDNGAEGDELIVATTRPEMVLGDTAIAVHPNDARYSHLRNKFVWHPIRKCKIPIIFDERVDPKLGTGALKVTPAHSCEDFEISRTHGLEVMDVFDEAGVVKKIKEFSNFSGMKIFDAREKILNEFSNLGLYKGKIPHSMVIPICMRSGCVIEYVKKPQWFLRCSGMYEKVHTAILDGRIEIEPTYCTDILFEYFKNGRDWNLSRQIWLGHRIPMYECDSGGGKIWIGAASEEEARLMASKKFGMNPNGISVNQDPDVLDTWFSSGILPLTVSGWPKELSAAYPLGLMETGCDIIFFWVARMLMLGLEITDRIPFSKVILHGMVCDGYGKKMSKSLGNVILPEYIINGISLKDLNAEAKKRFSDGLLGAGDLQLNIEGQKKLFPAGIPKCGADALRLALSNDIIRAERVKFDLNVVKEYTCLCNKIWQATIYLVRCIESKSDLKVEITDDKLSLMDRWILSRLAGVIETVDSSISILKHHTAVEAIKIFLLKEFCAAYLENTKIVIKTGSEDDARRVIAILFISLETLYRLLSPFVPFIAEELYHCLPRLEGFTPVESITVAEFPDPNHWGRYKNSDVNELLSICLDILHSIRTAKNIYKLNSQKLKVTAACPADLEDLFSDELTKFLKRQAALYDFTGATGDIPQSNAIVLPVGNCTIYLYHEHTKTTLAEIFAPILCDENELMMDLKHLKSKMSDTDYENQTSSDMKKKNSNSVKKLTEKLKRIEEVKQVIANAQ